MRNETTVGTGLGEPAYTVRVTRNSPDGGQQVVEFEDYGVLRELLDDIQEHADVQLWLDESDG